MNNDNKVETAIAGLNCWASYATGDFINRNGKALSEYHAKSKNFKYLTYYKLTRGSFKIQNHFTPDVTSRIPDDVYQFFK